jgi:hypothetical protein
MTSISGASQGNSSASRQVRTACLVRCVGALGAIISLSASPLVAQAPRDSTTNEHRLPFRVTASIGGGSPTGDTRCKSDAYLLPGLEIQTRGRLFIGLGAEWIQSFGVMEACEIVALPRTRSDGTVEVRGDNRFDLDGGAHLTGGIGYYLPFGIEAKVKVGAARGQDDFPSRWFPSLTAALGVSIWPNHLIISLDRRWFRIPYLSNRYANEDAWREAGSPLAPDGTAERSRWRAFHALTFGLRF